MSAGVGIVSPALVDIDPRAKIGQDTVVHPFTVIEGAVTIGENCSLGPHAIVRNVDLREGEVVKPFEVRE